LLIAAVVVCAVLPLLDDHDSVKDGVISDELRQRYEKVRLQIHSLVHGAVPAPQRAANLPRRAAPASRSPRLCRPAVRARLPSACARSFVRVPSAGTRAKNQTLPQGDRESRARKGETARPIHPPSAL
jgi:hypothetical protein